MFRTQFGLIVIGAGPAGVTSALEARELGVVPLSPEWPELGQRRATE